MIRWIVNGLFSIFNIYVIFNFFHINNIDMVMLMTPYILMLLLQVILLTFNNKPKAGASSITEVIIPVFGSAWPVIAGHILQPRFVEGLPILINAGLVCMAVLYLIELITLATLRHSFSILPEARKTVKTGLYRYIRHPLYSLYIVWAGINVALTQDIRYFLFGLLPLAIFLYLRALMEEQKLIENLEDYQEYRDNTGMFFPRLIKRNMAADMSITH